MRACVRSLALSSFTHTHVLTRSKYKNSPETMAVGCARLGQPDQKIVAGTLAELATVDFGAPLHCMVICGELHPCETELLAFFKAKEGDLNTYVRPAESDDSSSSSSDGEGDDGGQ